MSCISFRAEHSGGFGARLETMEREVVCPRDQWAANAAAGNEVASGDRISELVRVATIVDHGPEPVDHGPEPVEDDSLPSTLGPTNAWTL